MYNVNNPSATGVLISGGLDSSILLAQLLERNRIVQPFYVRSGLAWQRQELEAAQRFLKAVDSPNLRDLVVFDLPLADVYAAHWSITGEATPDANSPDEAVHLPARNALLLIKAVVWCQLNGVQQLALAPLGTSPFEDATPGFFDGLQSALNHASRGKVEIVRPFESMNKCEVMRLGIDYPLALTFSCIAPAGDLHCGQCNKCAERQEAFESADIVDQTRYMLNQCTM